MTKEEFINILKEEKAVHVLKEADYCDKRIAISQKMHEMTLDNEGSVLYECMIEDIKDHNKNFALESTENEIVVVLDYLIEKIKRIKEAE